MTLNHTSLPDWVYEPMPTELTEIAIISWNDEFQEFVVRFGKNNNMTTPFERIDEAYDFIKDKRNAQVVFDESVHGHQGKIDVNMFFGENNRLLISHTDSESLDLLQYWMDSFQETNAKYLENPHDWVQAYNWLDLHPAFWTHESGFHWNNSNGLSEIYTSVWRDSNKTYVTFEHGSHVPPKYDHFYHDLRLDVVAENFENAYVKLAKKVDEHFDSFGVERATSA